MQSCSANRHGAHESSTSAMTMAAISPSSHCTSAVPLSVSLCAALAGGFTEKGHTNELYRLNMSVTRGRWHGRRGHTRRLLRSQLVRLQCSISIVCLLILSCCVARLTRVWTLLPTSNKPLSRAYLQAAVVGDACFIFGRSSK